MVQCHTTREPRKSYDALMAYQPPSLEGLKVRHDALRDIWPSQVNTLNVEGKGNLKTLTFTDNVALLEVHF